MQLPKALLAVQALHHITLTVNILILEVELVAKDRIELLKLFDLSKKGGYVSSDKIEAAFVHLLR